MTHSMIEKKFLCFFLFQKTLSLIEKNKFRTEILLKYLSTFKIYIKIFIFGITYRLLQEYQIRCQLHWQ